MNDSPAVLAVTCKNLRRGSSMVMLRGLEHRPKHNHSQRAPQCLLLAQSGHVKPKLHSGARACRRGSLEIIISPEKGWLSSKIRKIAHDAESAKRDRQVKTVTFKSENRLKLANMMRRVCTKSVLSCPARV